MSRIIQPFDIVRDSLCYYVVLPKVDTDTEFVLVNLTRQRVGNYTYTAENAAVAFSKGVVCNIADILYSLPEKLDNPNNLVDDIPDYKARCAHALAMAQKTGSRQQVIRILKGQT